MFVKVKLKTTAVRSSPVSLLFRNMLKVLQIARIRNIVWTSLLIAEYWFYDWWLVLESGRDFGRDTSTFKSRGFRCSWCSDPRLQNWTPPGTMIGMFVGGPHNEAYDLFRELAELHRPAPECARGQMPMLDVFSVRAGAWLGNRGMIHYYLTIMKIKIGVLLSRMNKDTNNI